MYALILEYIYFGKYMYKINNTTCENRLQYAVQQSCLPCFLNTYCRFISFIFYLFYYYLNTILNRDESTRQNSTG